MNEEATLEVPKKFRAGIQSQLVDFRNDALGTIGRAAIDMSDEPPENIEEDRKVAKAVTPLVDQGAAQLSKGVTIYKGSAEWLGWTLKWRMNHVSEVLHGVMGQNTVDTGRARGMLEELSWLNDALEGVEREAVAA